MRSGPNNSNHVADREFTNSVAEAGANGSSVNKSNMTQRTLAKQKAEKEADEHEAILRKLQRRSSAEDPSKLSSAQPKSSRKQRKKKLKEDGTEMTVGFQESVRDSAATSAPLADDVLPPPPSVPLTSQALLMFMNQPTASGNNNNGSTNPVVPEDPSSPNKSGVSSVKFSSLTPGGGDGAMSGVGPNTSSGAPAVGVDDSNKSISTTNRINVNQDDLALAEVGGMYHMSRMVDWTRKDVNIFERSTLLPKVVVSCLPTVISQWSVFMVPFRYKAVENEFLRYEYRGQRYFLAVLAFLSMLVAIFAIVLSLQHTGPLVISIVMVILNCIVLCIEISMIVTTNPTRQRISDALSQAKTAEVNQVLWLGVSASVAAFSSYMVMEICPEVANSYSDTPDDKAREFCTESFVSSALLPTILAVLQGRPRLVFFLPILFICIALTFVGRITAPVDERDYLVAKVFASGVAYLIMFTIHRQREMDKRRHFIEYAVYQSQVELAAKRSKALRDFVDNMLPPVMRQRLLGFKTVMDISESGTCVFVDIANFSQFTFSVLPQDAATSVATLAAFCSEQAIVAGIDRVRSVGDRFIGVSNLVTIAEDHASRCARFGLLLYNAINFSPMFHGRGLALRCGIHSGQLMGGVVGETHIRYDLYGPAYTVGNTIVASCPPSMIMCTQESFVLFAVTKNIISEPARAMAADGTIIPVEVECPMTQTRHYMHYVLGMNLAPQPATSAMGNGGDVYNNSGGVVETSNTGSESTIFSIPNSENLMEVGSAYFGSASHEINANGEIVDQQISHPFELQGDLAAMQEAHDAAAYAAYAEAQLDPHQFVHGGEQPDQFAAAIAPPARSIEASQAVTVSTSPPTGALDNNYRLTVEGASTSASELRGDTTENTNSSTMQDKPLPPHQAPVHVRQPLESNVNSTNPMALHSPIEKGVVPATHQEMIASEMAMMDQTREAAECIVTESYPTGPPHKSNSGNQNYVADSITVQFNEDQAAVQATQQRNELAQRLSDEEVTLLTARRLVSQMVVEDYSTSTSLQRQKREMRMETALKFESEVQEDHFQRHRVDHDLRNLSIYSAGHVLILILCFVTLLVERVNSSDMSLIVSVFLTATLGISSLIISYLAYREMKQRSFKRKKITEWENVGMNAPPLATFHPVANDNGGADGDDLIKEQDRGLQFVYVAAARIDGETRNFVTVLLAVYHLNLWLIPFAIALSRPSMPANDLWYIYTLLALTAFVALPFKRGVIFFIAFTIWVCVWSVLLDGFATLWSMARLPVVLFACCYKEYVREKAQRVSFHDVGLTQQAVDTINHEEDVRACVLQGMIPPPVQKRAAASRFSGQFVTWALSDLVVLNIRFDNLTSVTTSTCNAEGTIELIKQTTGHVETVIKTTCKTLAIVSLFGDNFLLAGPLMDGNEVDVQASACEAILLVDAIHGNPGRTATKRQAAQTLASGGSINSYGSSIRDRSRGEDPTSPNGMTVTFPLGQRPPSQPSSLSKTVSGAMSVGMSPLNNMAAVALDVPGDRKSQGSSLNNTNGLFSGSAHNIDGDLEDTTSPLQQLSRTCTTVGAIGHATCVLTSNEYPTFDVFGISLNMVRAMLFATPTIGRPWISEKLFLMATRATSTRLDGVVASETDSAELGSGSTGNSQKPDVRPNAAYLQELLKLVQESGVRFGMSETWSVRGYGQLRVKSVIPRELQQLRKQSGTGFGSTTTTHSPQREEGGGSSSTTHTTPGKYQVPPQFPPSPKASTTM